MTLATHPDRIDDAPARPSRRLKGTIIGLVVAVAAVGYAITGLPPLLNRTPPPTAAAPGEGAADREASIRQIAGMVDGLAARLKDRPDDAEGWAMLARSYAVLGRFDDAIPAYRHAIELRPQDAPLLADFADALGSQSDGPANAEVAAAIERALAIDPVQPKALALSGVIAFDRGDFAKAATQWQKIADALPPDSEFRAQVQQNIDEAKRRGRLAGLPAAGGAPPPGLSVSPEAAVANAAGAIAGTVTLSPSLAAKVGPADTLFVYARAEGDRMPLAVFRATAKELPLRYRLDDSMAMTAAGKISGAARVVVTARISKSGNAIPQPGDLFGDSRPVTPGAKDADITIASEQLSK